MAELGNPKNTIEILQKYQFRFSKKYGQNCLIDTRVLDKIIRAADISKEDYVLEIGPGIGTLTQYLAEAAKHVIAVEIDDKLIPILQDTLSAYNNVTILHQDILKVDLNQLVQQQCEGRPLKVVANLPYYITTPIIMGLFENHVPIQSITVMVQKEVADRITAMPGDKLSGAITYSVNYYAEAKKIVFVDKSSFIPAPEVDSEVIKLDIRKTPVVEVDNEEMFFRVIKASFMQRRKTLVNGLVNSGIITDKVRIKEIFDNIGIDMNIRGEKLTIEQFAELSNLIYRDI